MSKKDINNEKKQNNFFKEVKSELKKVTWPTLKKLVNNTSAVISIVLIVALIVFVFDVCFEKLNDVAIGGLKSLVSSNEEQVEENSESSDEQASQKNTDEVQENTENVEENVDTTESSEEVTQ